VSDYLKFLATKERQAETLGAPCLPSDVHSTLHAWQAEIVCWAVSTGRAAIWADTGLGKTFMQLEWARLSGETALIVAPLAVCAQTVREAHKLGIDARYVRHGEEIVGRGVWVTNYEMVKHFDPTKLDAVVLDESSILKNSSGAMRSLLIEHFRPVPRRLSCTATPAPNDPEELTNQAEFLGVISRAEMLAAYFVHDSDAGWRLKGHARRPMFKWMASWALAIRRPSDLGYSDAGYDLMPLRIHTHLLAVDVVPDGQLFATEIGGVGGRAKVRRATLTARVERVVELVHDCGPIHLQRRVLPSEQGEVEADTGAEGDPQSPEATALRGGRAASGAGDSTGQRVSGSAPIAQEGVDVRAEQGSDRANDRPRMRDLSRESEHRPDRENGNRPRPLNGHGPRCSVPAMQLGARTHAGRSDSDHGDVSLPHGCVDQWVIWCGLNDEQDTLARLLGSECRSIDGRTPVEDRVSINEDWIAGKFRILLVKPGMYSFGMNWQHCARMAFVGLNDSYESYYQSIRRCYRYGQTRVVHAHVVLSDLEGQIASNVRRKETEAGRGTGELVRAIQEAKKELVA
jgi:hypothetical protein